MSSQRVYDNALELVAKGTTQTSSTNGTSLGFEAGRLNNAVCEINVTAVSGTTPSLTPILQASNDNGSTWKTVTQGNPITAAGRYELGFTGAQVEAVCPKSSTNATLVRFATTISGTTPSFTFGAFLTKS